MDQIVSDGFTTFRVSKDLTMYKVTFTNHYKMNVSGSNAKFMNFYPFKDIKTISSRPMLFITGDKAHSKEFSEDAYKHAAAPKKCFTLKMRVTWIYMIKWI